MTHTLRLGSRGTEVATLQRRLNAFGAHLALDHIYGPATAAAVRAYQRKHGLVADGIAGPRTLAQLVARVELPANLLTQGDLDTAAQKLGCEAAAIQAVVQVESGATGWLPDGRVAILFERHIMYRQLKAAGIDPEPYAITHPDIVDPKPGGYRGGAGEYRRLAQAKQIDTDCALASASWGRFQIMGFHWRDLGYASVAEFVAAMQHGEQDQLDAFVRFIEKDKPMHKALCERDWLAFARSYNGPESAKNHYAGRLERAYSRHATAESKRAPKPASKPPKPAPQASSDPALQVPEPPPPADVGSNDLAVPPRRRKQPSKTKPSKKPS